jgi:SAM-dependent methyltransferase
VTDDQVFHARHGTGADPSRDTERRDRVYWIVDHLPASRPGRPIAVLDLGCAGGELSLLLAEKGDRVTGVDIEPSAVADALRRRDRLPADVASRIDFTVKDAHALDGVPGATFDAAVVGGLLDHVGDPVQVLGELHRTLRPGATLVFTVPYGVSDAVLRIARAAGTEQDGAPPPAEPAGPGGTGGATAPGEGEQDDEHGDKHGDDGERRRVFYHGSLRHLVEPLFEIRELTVLRRHLAGVAVRRDEARGTPGFALSRAESAFLQRERHLHGEIADLRERCAEHAAREIAHARSAEDLLRHNAELLAEADRLRHRVKHLEGRLAEYRDVISRLRLSRAWRLVTAYRRVRYPVGRVAVTPTAKRPIVIAGSAAPVVTRPALPGRTETSTPASATPAK